MFTDICPSRVRFHLLCLKEKISVAILLIRYVLAELRGSEVEYVDRLRGLTEVLLDQLDV